MDILPELHTLLIANKSVLIMKKYAFILAIPVICVLSGCNSTEYRKISVDEYIQRAEAGWIGQMAGVGWGRPTEFKWKGVTVPAEKMPEWTPGMINQFNQDRLRIILLTNLPD